VNVGDLQPGIQALYKAETAPREHHQGASAGVAVLPTGAGEESIPSELLQTAVEQLQQQLGLAAPGGS